ncbi:MAG: AAA family ATPase [Syntrophomonadaceae bacterium]|nr:AAA family ATPase [Syntrophomonadaceae bacterium]
MPTVISVINLKGGVGKTTVTVALAEFLALEFGYRVLVVDTDPQTNATVSLISEKEWERRNRQGRTIAQLFRDKLENRHVFVAEEAIVKGVSNVGGGIPNLDLLPSSLDLVDLQDRMINMPTKDVFSANPVEVMGEALAEVLVAYDFVLIDCPPNLGLITQNGLIFSNYYLIPVIPDVLSTYGIPQIVTRINRFGEENRVVIPPLGIIITRYRAQSSIHRGMVKNLQAKSGREYPRVFATILAESNQAAAAMDVTNRYSTLKRKYGYAADGVYEQYKKLAKELLRYVG